MEQQLPMALQVALYTASGALVVVAAVVVYVLFRFTKQLEQTLTAVKNTECELVPLAKETRVVVDRLRDLSERAERAVDAAGRLVPVPVRAFHHAAQLLQTGAMTFLQALWNGLPQRRRTAKETMP